MKMFRPEHTLPDREVSQMPWTLTMNLRQNGIFPPSTALWASTHAMQSPCLGHSVFGQLQFGLSS